MKTQELYRVTKEALAASKRGDKASVERICSQLSDRDMVRVMQALAALSGRPMPKV